MVRSAVFAQTYHNYLEQIFQIDFLSRAEILGLKRDGDKLIIPLYDNVYTFSAEGLTENDKNEITPAVQIMICKYILTCPHEKLSVDNRLVTYREFKNSGPLTSYFTTNTNKIIETTFSGDLACLREKALSVNGELMESDVYDLSLRFYAFPRIPVLVNFNDRDDLFPATCSILYRSTAAQYLDMESLSMTGTLLAGKLIAPVLA